MSEEGIVSSLYPPPPPYVKFFTNENVQKVRELRESGTTDEQISEMKDLLFQVPPVQPDRPTYRSFGDVWPFEDRFITLKESGMPQLYPGGDKGDEEEEQVFTQERIEELKKLTKSLLLNFLELVGLLGSNANESFAKIDEIRIVLINLHHLLNSYRLHQSRESLILRIQERVRMDKETIDKIEQTCKTVEDRIKMLVNSDEIPFEQPPADDVDMEAEPTETAADAEAMKRLKAEAVKEITR